MNFNTFKRHLFKEAQGEGFQRMSNDLKEMLNDKFNPSKFGKIFDIFPINYIKRTMFSCGLTLIGNDGKTWKGKIKGDEGEELVDIAFMLTKENNKYQVIENRQLSIKWIKKNGLFNILVKVK